MRPSAEELQFECGLSHAEAGASAAEVYRDVTGQEVDPAHPGWEKAAVLAAGMYAGEEGEEVAVPVTDFAALLRKGYARAADVDDVSPFAELPLALRVGWEGVARHLANVCGMDQEAARHLEAHRLEVVRRMRQRLAKPTP